MRTAMGIKTHCGWASLVVLRQEGGAFQVGLRRRLDLGLEDWAKMPYHAAEELSGKEARDLVLRGVTSARRAAIRAMESVVAELRGVSPVCAILCGDALPDWTVDQILTVHFRMHTAEGRLYQDVFMEAALKLGLRMVPVREKSLMELAEKSLGVPADEVLGTITQMGKLAGPPWGQDQKAATMAAMIALADA